MWTTYRLPVNYVTTLFCKLITRLEKSRVPLITLAQCTNTPANCWICFFEAWRRFSKNFNSLKTSTPSNVAEKFSYPWCSAQCPVTRLWAGDVHFSQYTRKPKAPSELMRVLASFKEISYWNEVIEVIENAIEATFFHAVHYKIAQCGKNIWGAFLSKRL